MKLKKASENFMIYCRETRKMSPNTTKSYEHAVRRFNEFITAEFSVTDVEKVVKSHLLEYRRNLSNNYSASSAMHHFTVIHVFFNYLEDYNYIEDSPFRRIHDKRMRIPKRVPVTLTVEEIHSILTAVYLFDSNDCYASIEGEEMLRYRDCLVLETLFNTGMRVQEMCNLKMSDYDMKTGIIKFVGKGSKERICYITAENYPGLYLRYVNLRNDFLKTKGCNCSNIFVNRFGGPLSAQSVRAIISKYTEAAGIQKHVTPHVFRHSFATLLMEQGVNLRYIQEYLGHETILTTQRYLHINQKAAQDTLKEKHPRRLIEPEMYNTNR